MVRCEGKMTELKDLVYRAGSDRGLLDLVRPAGDGPFPVAVCLHGGGWREGDKDRVQGYVPFLADTNIAAVVPKLSCCNIRLLNRLKSALGCAREPAR